MYVCIAIFNMWVHALYEFAVKGEGMWLLCVHLGM